ncbi:3-hydroxyisobutyryl-CoA hydrolase 1-like [Impatiens glandulifera]|uniref:3-hydroxyisobutyryl-CoA hydrolase 1-like n=1 Tax=Impatiens glandulifera TaxID=253017 RepID=UPI001FB164F5|nr:3-hydroxyisobutyryl-CoA hydrolase 1-like [Impatiens glandulifera]
MRKVILNRPGKLNTLNYQMVMELFKNLTIYERDPSVNLVMVKGNGKAFCAGGDIIAVLKLITEGHWSFALKFYEKQLRLDHMIATYKKPMVSIVNGIIMGGGVAISIFSKFQIVTENTLFAMPEAAIGLFPDVGASYFLSRLSGYFGEYIGLTGIRLDGADIVACGLATHFVHSKDVNLLENAIEELSRLSQTIDISMLNETINIYAQKPCLKQSSPLIRLEMINRCFSNDTVEKILDFLVNLSTKNCDKWIIDTINSMKSASPTSLKLFLRSIREGRTQKLDQCLVREYNAIAHLCAQSFVNDFLQGSRAMLVDKDKKPKWKYSMLEEVKEEIVKQHFEEMMGDEEFKPLLLDTSRTSNLDRSSSSCTKILPSRH